MRNVVSLVLPEMRAVLDYDVERPALHTKVNQILNVRLVNYFYLGPISPKAYGRSIYVGADDGSMGKILLPHAKRRTMKDTNLEKVDRVIS